MDIIHYHHKLKTIMLGLCLLSFQAIAQNKTVVVKTPSPSTRTVLAGDYKNSPRHRFWFGRHYREEWLTPVTVPVLMLDTARGGLTPYVGGIRRQSISLYLHDKNGREYVLRSLDKSFGQALSERMQNTFIEDAVDDQVTIGHPYGSLTIPTLAQAAGIHYTKPTIVFVPSQPALDSFNAQYGDRVYLLEQMPKGNWETATHLGSPRNIINTQQLMHRLQESSSNVIDQELYVRSRLFDIWIGDWGRQEEHWYWGEHRQNDKTVYQPIPLDRDQAYSRFNGLLPKITLRAAKIKHLHTFNDDVKNIKTYNYTTRHLDRRMANEMTLQQWVSIAHDLEKKLTDDVIEKAIHSLPAEVYSISGPDIASKLKSRRGHLVKFATDYYKFLARHVDVVGSKEKEHFEVKRLNDEETQVNVYSQNAGRGFHSSPSYARTFRRDETKDVRLYGIGGNDVFNIAGNVDRSINIRVVGSDGRDSIIDRSVVDDGKRKTNVYDDWNNYIARSEETKLHLTNDTAVHAYDYTEFDYHKKGVRFSMSYDNPDRYYIGLGYVFARHYWRKTPHSFDQGLFLRYSISQNAFRIMYRGTFYQALGKWNVNVDAWQDFVRWTFFYGLGNETIQAVSNRRYYRLRTNEFYLGAGLNRKFGKYHTVDFTGFYQGIEIINDPNRFVSDNYTPNQLYFFEHHQYLGARVGYNYQNVNNRSVPTKGLMFFAGAGYTENILVEGKGFATYNSILQLYVPLFGKFSYATRNGITTVQGEPEFYQYASVGGSQTIRGFRRDRFWGKTAFYNSNEIRWITDLNSYYMKGKIGVLGFVDDGRVWMPGEKSNLWHVGYGGGILLAPFDLATMSLTYGLSNEGGTIHFRLNRAL
jgi:hypothetical protein